MATTRVADKALNVIRKMPRVTIGSLRDLPELVKAVSNSSIRVVALSDSGEQNHHFHL